MLWKVWASSSASNPYIKTDREGRFSFLYFLPHFLRKSEKTVLFLLFICRRGKKNEQGEEFKSADKHIEHIDNLGKIGEGTEIACRADLTESRTDIV